MTLTLSSGYPRILTTRTKLFMLLNLADYALTAIMIKQGLGFEGNPLLNWMPFGGVGVVKIVVVYLVARHLGDRITLMILLNVGMGMVVAWNMFWLLYLALGGKG